MEMPGQVCLVMERGGQNRTRGIGEVKIKGRAGSDQDSSNMVLAKVEADLGQTIRMTGKRHEKASKAGTGDARLGRGMVG